MPQIKLDVEAKLPELKGNPALYKAFSSNSQIDHFDPETFEEAEEKHGKNKSLKAMRTKLKTDAQDAERAILRKGLQERLAVVLADPSIAAKLGI